MVRGHLASLVKHLRRGLPAEDGSDAHLLERFARRRDEPAFAELVRRHGPLVLGVCLRVLGNGHDAEDACQATFLVLARKAASVRRGASLGGWLYQVAYHIAAKARAARARPLPTEEPRPMNAPDPAAEAARRELSALLDAELHALPDKYRLPLVLCYLQGKATRQAAHELGWPEGSMSKRLGRARELLRARLARRGVAFSIAGLSAALSESAAVAFPPMLAQQLVRAGLAYPGAVSPNAAALAEGALAMMVFTRGTILAALALLVVFVGAGAGALLHGASADPTDNPAPITVPAPAAQGKDPPLKQGGVVVIPRKPHWQADGGFRGRSCLAVSPDGKTLATGAGPGAVRLWDTADGTPRAILREKGAGWVSGLAFSPDGKTLASSGEGDKGVLLWESADGWKTRSLTAAGDVLDAVSYSPDGKTVAAMVRMGEIHTWDVGSGKVLARFGSPGIWAIALPFSPDGKLLASGGTGRAVSLWDPATGKLLRKLEDPEIDPEPKGGPLAGGPPRRIVAALALAFSPNGSLLAWGNADGTLTLWEPGTGKLVRRLQKSDPSGAGFLVCSVAFAPDGRTLASAGSDKMIRLWDVATGKELGRLEFHKAQVWAVAFTPDGKHLASLDNDGQVCLWRMAPGGAEKQPMAGDKLKIEIAPARAKISADEPVEVAVIYTNVSKEPLKLMASGVRPGTAFDGETFEITHGGRTRNYSFFGIDPRVEEVTIKPGESWKRTFKDLRAEIADGQGVNVDGQVPVVPPTPPMTEPGEYRLRLRYNGTIKNPNLGHFMGPALSNVARVTIKPGRVPAPPKDIETIRADLDKFVLDVFPPQRTDKTPRIVLSVEKLRLPSVRELRVFHITREQAADVLNSLAANGYFDKATRIDRGTKDVEDKLFRGVTLGTEKTPLYLEGKWDAATVRYLEIISKHVPAEARQALDALLKEMGAGVRLWTDVTKQAVKTLKANLNAFYLELNYWADREQKVEFRPPSLHLRVELLKEPGQVMQVGVDRAQAEKLIEYLAADGFFDRAKDVEGKTIAYTGPAYVLSVGAPPPAKGFRRHDENLGHGDRMLRALYALARALDGDAAKAMGQLLRRVDDRPPPGSGGWRVRGKLVGHEGAIHALAVSPDGKLLASCDAAGVARLWDLATMKEVATLRGHKGDLLCLAFAPNGKTLATGGVDHTVRLWNVASGQEVGRFQAPTAAVGAVAISPNGMGLATAGPAPAQAGREEVPAVHFWNPGKGREVRRARLEGRLGGVMALAFSPDGKSLAVATPRAVDVLDATSGKLVGTLEAYNFGGLAYTPDGRHLLVGGASAVQFWDMGTLKEDGLRKLSLIARNLSLAGDGRRLAVVGYQKIEGKEARHLVEVHDLTREGELATLEDDSGYLSAVALSPDGRTVAAGGNGRTIRVWHREK